jgi:hypothetical protein
MKITLWLPVYETASEMSNADELWHVQRTTGALPDGRDGVVLFPHEDDPGDGPMVEVRRRYMDADGGWQVELSRMVLDRQGPIPTQTSAYTNGQVWMRWHQPAEQLFEGLRQAGWVRR